MQNNKIERKQMSKIRMNTELRNKLFKKIKNVFENEDTQEREAFLQAREIVDQQYDIASILAIRSLTLDCNQHLLLSL